MLEIRLTAAYTAVDFMSGNVSGVVETVPAAARGRDAVLMLMDDTTSSNEYIASMGIYMEPNAYDGSDEKYIQPSNPEGRFAAFTKGSGNVTYVQDYQSADWYKVPMSTQKIYLSNPYMRDNDIIATFSMPIVNGSNSLGVVTADVNLGDFQTLLEQEVGTDTNDYKALFSSVGVVIAHSSNPERLMSNILDTDAQMKEHLDNAASGKEGETKGDSYTTGEKSVMIFTPVDTHTDKHWLFESSTTNKYLAKGVMADLIFVSAVNIATIILISIVIMIIAKKFLTDPLNIISDGFTKMSEYNLNLEENKKIGMKYANQNDEVGRLTIALNTLYLNIKEIVQNITGHAQNTAATAEELTATAQSTSDSAGEVASAVNNIAQGATSQAQDTTEAAQEIPFLSKL